MKMLAVRQLEMEAVTGKRIRDGSSDWEEN